MALRLLAVTYDAHDPARLAHFWAGVLDRDVVDDGIDDGGGVLVPGTDTQLGLRFVRSDSVKSGRHRMHLHLTSEGTEQRAVVDWLLAAGATHLDVGQLPDEGHVALADPEGYELCVIEPGNDFLRGCGPLGEMACDGPRALGVFWSQALGWPLVWDEGEETVPVTPRRHQGLVGRRVGPAPRRAPATALPPGRRRRGCRGGPTGGPGRGTRPRCRLAEGSRRQPVRGSSLLSRSNDVFRSR